VVLAEAGRVEQRGEGRDRADGERRPVLEQRVEDDVGVEAVGQHQRRRSQQADLDVTDQSGDVEQRCDTEDRAVAAGPHPVPVDLGGEDHVAVGVHRPLGHPRRPGRVGQERHVLRRQPDRWRDLAPVRGDELAEVGRALVSLPRRPGEQPLVVPGLELQFAGGQHQPHVRVRDDAAADLAVECLEREQHRRAGVLQQVGQLPLAAHRVDRHHHPAGLPGGHHGDHELRHVLQVHRQPVTRGEPAAQQTGREGVTELVEFGAGDDAVEVAQRDCGRVAGQPGPEHVQGVVELQCVVGRLVTVERQPWPLVVDAHRSGYLMTTGLTGEPAAFAMFSGAAT
jgi:hypothetical protein